MQSSARRKQMAGLRLSDKHGVNRGMSICFWCQESTSVILYGRLKRDAKAPMRVVMDYTPCDKCKAAMEKGIMIIEAVTSEEPPYPGGRPLSPNVYPTGNWWVITVKAAINLISTVHPEVLKRVLEQKTFCVTPQDAKQLGLPKGERRTDADV